MFTDPQNFNENDESNKSSINAAKRKGSFKKWLRSSHRKFTSNASNNRNGGLIKENGSINAKLLNLTTNSDLETLKNKVKFLNNLYIITGKAREHAPGPSYSKTFFSADLVPRISCKIIVAANIRTRDLQVQYLCF